MNCIYRKAFVKQSIVIVWVLLSGSHSVMEQTWRIKKYLHIHVVADKLNQPSPLMIISPNSLFSGYFHPCHHFNCEDLDLEWAFSNVDHHDDEMGRQVHLCWVQLRLWKQFQIWLDLQNSSKWWIKSCNGDWGHWKREPIQDYRVTVKGGLSQCQCWCATEHAGHLWES